MRWLVLGVGAPFAALVTFVVFVAAVISPASNTTSVAGVGVSSGSCTVVTSTVSGLSAEQQANAVAIARVALDLGLGAQGATIVIDAALTESSLVNVNFGDRSANGQMTTSRGILQQKQEWGDISVRMDPAGAARLFFAGGRGGQRGLMQLPRWQTLPIPQAAQAIQGSAFSGGGNYLKNLLRAEQITAAILACTAPVVIPAGTGSAAMAMNLSQDPTTYGWVRAGPMEPLVWQGHSFGQVARGTAPLWQAAMTALAPHIPGGIITGDCFADRQNVNHPSVASLHAFGIACDWNPSQNPNGSAPAALQGGRFVLPMNTDQILAPFGLIWGGTFRGVKDGMHGELHWTPAQVAQFIATAGVA